MVAAIVALGSIGAPGCGGDPPPARAPSVAAKAPARAAPSVVVRAAFADPDELPRWQADLSEGAAVNAAVVDGAARAELVPSGSAAALVRRTVDAGRLRGHRIRLRARLRARDAAARATLRVHRAGGEPGIGDVAETPPQRGDRWDDQRAVVDVARDATELELEVEARGSGRAWIDDVTVEDLGPPDPAAISARALGPAERARLEVLARVMGAVRYFHPSDQSAALDWDAFAPEAVARVLAAGDRPLEEVLGELLRPIAPTARLHRGDRPAPVPPDRAGRSALTWWFRAGLGPEFPYTGFRVNLDPPAARAVLYAPVPRRALVGCRHAVATARAEEVRGMEIELRLRFLQSGMRDEVIGQPLGAGADGMVEHDVPAETVDVQVGVSGSGEGTAAVGRLTFACDGHRPHALDLDGVTGEGVELAESVYDRVVEPCASGACLRLRRRDRPPPGLGARLVDVEVGSGLRLALPAAVPVEAGRTLPAAAPVRPPAAHSVWDRATRLAAVAMAWTTLDHFYPYFAESDVDWSRELGPALERASLAATPDQTRAVLAHLVARLADDHARVLHPGRSLAGILPLSLRRLGGALVVTGGVEPYLGAAGIGSEVVSIDGRPASSAYARVGAEISAATDGWLDWATPLYLTIGPIGTIHRLELRGAHGDARELVLPVLSREELGVRVREPRPRTGSELAPGVSYVDLEGLEAAAWRDALDDLGRARAIVFDMRGYLTPVAWDVVSHLSARPVTSPLLDIPLVGAAGFGGFDRTWWQVRPRPPLLRAVAVFLVDGRTASAGETLMQMIRDHSLGVLVGEPTGGTNGNPVVAPVPGGFGVRFTGMRVLGLRGQMIHARGIAPDVVAHPTLAGVRARRDEVLEVGIRVAREQARLRRPADRGKPARP